MNVWGLACTGTLGGSVCPRPDDLSEWCPLRQNLPFAVPTVKTSFKAPPLITVDIAFGMT